MIILKILFGLVILAVLAVGGTVGLAVWYFGRDLPDYKQLADYEPPIVTRVYAGDGKLLAEYATEKRVFMPVKAMPHLVLNAFIAAEDKEFYSHPGINLGSMMRAGLTDVMRLREGRRPVGASTITQQVAKNFFLGNEVSLQRKVKEALVAIRMEQALSKERILELYLNEIYLGGGSYGVAAAALSYFNKSLDELDVAEAAFLGGLPKAPNAYNPQRNPEAAKGRRDWVIDRMAEDGLITAEQAETAKAEPLKTVRRAVSDTVTANYFAEEVRRELVAQYGENDLYKGGLTVRTSLNPKLQAMADKALRDGLIAYDRRHGWRGPSQHLQPGPDWRPRLAALPAVPGADEVGWKSAFVLSTNAEGASIGLTDGTIGHIPATELRWAHRLLPGDVVLVEPLTGTPSSYGLRQIPEVSGAMVVIDPHTGRVLAISGGFSYEISQFDRATQAHRQIGSAIKPFVYLAALQHGFTPSTRVLDGPIEVDQGPGLPKWTPANYTHKSYGLLPLRIGIEQSLDLLTVRLGTMIGLEAIAHALESFGIMDHMPREYSMVLGAGETTPLRLTTAYAMLVNGGKRLSPTLIDRVQDRDGATVYRADDRECTKCQASEYDGQPAPELTDDRPQVVDPASAYQMVSILQGVVERGTGHSIASLGRPLAGKTGTTNDSNDTWFVGFSPDLAAGVFVGYDTPKSLGGHETGATVAVPIFKEFMASALKDKPAVPFRIPPGVLLVRVDHATGQLPYSGDKNVILEAFKPGTEPNGESDTSTAENVSDDEDAASLAQAGLPSAIPPTMAGPTASAVPVEGIQPIQIPQHAAPSTGTGGLY
jgi:penicillin-binding protein 1A